MTRRRYGLTPWGPPFFSGVFAGLFVRLADVPVWDLILWRCGFAGLALVVISIAQPTQGAVFGWTGFGASILAAVTMAAYAASLTMTSVANVLIVYATMPFATAGLAWFLLGERSSRRMLVASTVSLAGVAVMAGQSLRMDDLAGIALALTMTLAFAGLLVVTRRFERIDHTRVNAVAALLCVALALPMFSGTVPSVRTLVLLAGLGILTTALSFLLFLEGGRHISSTEAALMSLLDVLLGPLWVWLVVAENPASERWSPAAWSWPPWSGISVRA